MARILIVDDAAFMRLLLRKIVVDAGYEVVGEAVDGMQALDKFRELQPDLVTLDVTMPHRDGLEVLELILAESPDARVIMCSALGQDAKIAAALKMGAADFIVKPFESDTVCRAIESVLGTQAV